MHQSDILIMYDCFLLLSVLFVSRRIKIQLSRQMPSGVPNLWARNQYWIMPHLGDLYFSLVSHTPYESALYKIIIIFIYFIYFYLY